MHCISRKLFQYQGRFCKNFGTNLPKQQVDHVVIGLGGLGSASTYWLSKMSRNQKIVGIEQFNLGHERGASHDHSRIIRYSYHTPEYVKLARAAYKAWDDVAADFGEELVVRTGGIDLFPTNCAIPMSTYTTSLDAEGIQYELISAQETMKRYPQFRLRDDVVALYQNETGIAPAARGTAAHQTLAQANGAILHDNTPVKSIHSSGRDGDDITVVTDTCEYRTGSVIICADGWTNELLSSINYHIPLEVTREQVVYYPAVSESLRDFEIGKFPVWIWMDNPSYYGFPVYGDLQSVKAAEDVGGEPTTARERSYETNQASLGRLTDFIRTTIPGMLSPASLPPPRVKTCLYTLTKDRDFVLDSVPGHPGIQVALGAAHGFKFASWFGRCLAERSLLGETSSYIHPFRLDRPAITDPNFVGNYIV